MHRSPKFVLSILLLIVSGPTHAFEDPALAVSAAQYRQRLQTATATDNRIHTLRLALRHATLSQWPQAIAAFEALVASGEDNPIVWLQLSEAWAEREDDSQAREQALEAAYNAWRSADDAAGRARALQQLGELYRRDGRPRQALAAWSDALVLERDPTLAARYRQLRDSLDFRVDGVDVTTDSATPEVCLRFSAPLAADPDIRYGDYLAFEPPIDAVVTAHDERLCVAGVEHGHDYRVTVRPGVPAADGQRTAAAASFTAAVGDRPARVGFRGNAYVLPRLGGQSLPLTTVNVEQVRLAVLRINDRNLTEQINADNLGQVLDGYASERIAERSGEPIWSGDLSIQSEPNREITTAVPMREVLALTEPGIYIVTAEDASEAPERWRDRATQWLVISDIGISTLRGADGLHVFLRSLADVRPLAGIELSLYARNNSALGHATSDETGYARFAPGLLRGGGGREPAALMAYAAGDYNFLDLTRSAFDLSDRGVGGRPAPGPFDAYLYSERGVYRPGESVELTALLRDAQGRGTDETLPLTLRMVRPDQVEAQRLTLNDAAMGGYRSRLDLPANARTGTWQVRAYLDPAAEPVGELDFQVEDFVPQQLRLALETEASGLQPGKPATVAVSGEYLYGAPAARLTTEAELTLQAAADPYPAYPGFHFGRVQDRFDARRFPLNPDATDAEGKTRLTLRLDEQPDTSLPLAASVRVSLFEPGGRPVNKSLTLPYRNQPFAIGIKPLFEDAVAENRDFAFELIALNPDGSPRSAAGLRYELIREDYDYYWYYQNNRWDYKRIVRDSQPLAARSVDVPADQPLQLTQTGLDWGYYRAEVYDPDTGVASSVRLRVGWFVAPSAGDSPDRLQLTLDRDRYSGGDTARVHIQAPFAGQVLLAVAGDKLWQHRSVELPENGTTVELPVDPDWSPGVYLTASAFRPAGPERGPGRAVGVAWLGLDPAPRSLDVAIQAPDEFRPRQQIELPVSVGGIDPGQSAYLTLAAVDEGILQLTDYASPDPLDYFLGKRRLGLDLLDLYGRLIDAGGRPGALRSGAGVDERNLDASGLKSVRTVALFSGPIRVDADGSARITLQLPDFNGELRLMAVAWDRFRYGRAERPLKIRDPLVSELYRPRFLAPGDRARLLLSLQNLSAPAGDYTARLSAGGDIALADATPLRVRFGGPDQPATLRQPYTLTALRPGTGELRLALTGPDGFALERHWPLEVRPAQTHVGAHRSLRLDPDETLRLDAGQLAAYLPGTAALRARLSSRPGLNVPELLAQLDRYPYGCLEQLTSRALPLVYFEPVAASWGDEAHRPELRQRVQRAIQQIFAMQRFEGGFGLWSADDEARFWLSAYTMDFLTRARANDYLVADDPYRRGLDWLRRQLGDSGYQAPELAARAYALYVLARAEVAPLGDLRYLHDNYLDRLPTRLARAQLGAALARYGDIVRARAAFQAALTELPGESEALGDYGSALRDQAALVALAAEAGLLDDWLPALAEQLATSADVRRYTSTQEQAWLLLAAHALTRDHGALTLGVDGRAVTGVDPYYLTPDPDELAAGIDIVNRGAAPVWARLDSSGVPASIEPPEQAGYTIARRYYTRDGNPVAPGTVAQNDLLVAVINGTIQPGALADGTPRQTLVVDLLPAGFELENARLANGVDTRGLDWLPELSDTAHVEIRADRYAAALNPAAGDADFTLAYLVRAVTPGEYIQPAVFVEDMYRPWLYGRGETGQLTIR